MPELVVNLIAAIKDNGKIAFWNIVGSNIANILLILGVTPTITSLKFHRSTIWKEIPFSLLAAFFLFVFANTRVLDKISLDSLFRFQGIIAFIFLYFYSLYI